MINRPSNKITKEDAYKNLELINSEIRNIDNKICFILAFIAIFVGFLSYRGATSILKETIKLDLNNIKSFPVKEIINLNFGQILPVIIIIILYILIISCFILLLIALKGKTRSKICKEYKLKADSIISFESIADTNYANYKKKNKMLNNYELINDINSQIYIKSIMCNTKYKLYYYSMKILTISFIIFFICEIFNIL